MERGFIHLWRALLDKPIWKNSTSDQRSVLIAILLMANHEPEDEEWKNKKLKVNPGQIITSLSDIKKLAGKSISIQNVRSAIARFDKLEFLTNESTKHGRLITVINWDIYQGELEKANKEANKGPTKPKPKKDRKSKKAKVYLKPYLGKFKNAKLTLEELNKLKNDFPNSYKSKIESLSHYVESTGRIYKSHYATILNWDRMNNKKSSEPIPPKPTSKEELDRITGKADVDAEKSQETFLAKELR